MWPDPQVPLPSIPRWFAAAAFALAAASGCGAPSDPARLPPHSRDARPAAVDTARQGMRGRYVRYGVRFVDESGRRVTGRLLRPDGDDPTRRYPAVLLQDGRELNSNAIEYLPPEFGDIVVLSLDYPDELPYTISVRQLLLESDRLRNAAERIPGIFSLGADYLVTRADVDAARLVLVATSFAVPFAVRAAAQDERFVNVGLIYGAGRMADVLAANLTVRPRVLRPALASLAMKPFAALAPERYAAYIAPRPLVMVNGSDDPQMPRRAVEALYDAAREPKSLIWLRTGHLMPTDTALVRTLVDTVLARLPALR